jgi:hypothetical protein
VQFDAEIAFTNGGGLAARGFRLDIPGSDIDEAELGELLVRRLGLLMVGTTTISNKMLLREAHKGSRDVVTGPATDAREDARPGPLRAGARLVLELADPDVLPRERGEARVVLSPAEARTPPGLPGLVDLPGVLVCLAGGCSLVGRAALVTYDVAGRAVLLRFGRPSAEQDRRPGLTDAAAAWLAEAGAVLVGTDQPDLAAPAEAGRHVMPTLVGAGIPVVTGLTRLDLLAPAPFRFSAVPYSGEPGRGWPVRAYALVD